MSLSNVEHGERIYQQVAAYTLAVGRSQSAFACGSASWAPLEGAPLPAPSSPFADGAPMFNTGLRTGEVLGLLNSDVDLEHRVLHLQRGVKEIARRDGAEFTSGREVKVGKLKSASSKRDVPLNQAAVDAILDLRNERYFGEDTPLVPDENGDYTRPVNFRRRYYRILEAAGIEQKGLHSIRHTFATTLVNGVKQPDGSIKSLTPRQVADLLGHSTSEITEMYYVKKDTARLGGITEGFEL